MSETVIEAEKKLRRRLGTLGAIRKEIVRVYQEARTAGADPLQVQFYRALTFILSSAAAVRKDEAIEDIEQRLNALEKSSEVKK
jgi:Fe2+ transport system protein FeoA